METPTTLGSPKLTGDGVLGKECSICAHPSQTARAVVAIITYFRLRHLSFSDSATDAKKLSFFGGEELDAPLQMHISILL